MAGHHTVDPGIIQAQLGVDAGVSRVPAAVGEPLHPLQLAVAHHHAASVVLQREDEGRGTCEIERTLRTRFAAGWEGGAMMTYQAVARVCSAGADHARAPEQELGERVHTGRVVHHGHSDALELSSGLVCLGGKGSGRYSDSSAAN